MSARWNLVIRTIGIIGCALLILLVPACGQKKEDAQQEQKTAEEEAAPPEAQKAQVVQAYGKLPLSFTENTGQVAEPVRFYLRGSRGTVYFTPQEVVYDVVEQTSRPDRRHPGEAPEMAEPDTTVRRRGVVVRMELAEADPDVRLEGVDQLQGKVNIFRGKDPDKWKTNIRTFSGIVYRDLYPGIDLSYQGHEGRLVPKIVVQPGANIEEIAFRYQGADSVFADDEGQLRIVTALGTLTEPAPQCYQENGEKKVPIKGRYRLKDKTTVGFEVGKRKKDRPLIISLAGA
jgi:hypothetical protein